MNSLISFNSVSSMSLLKYDHFKNINNFICDRRWIRWLIRLQTSELEETKATISFRGGNLGVYEIRQVWKTWSQSALHNTPSVDGKPGVGLLSTIFMWVSSALSTADSSLVSTTRDDFALKMCGGLMHPSRHPRYNFLQNPCKNMFVWFI